MFWCACAKACAGRVDKSRLGLISTASVDPAPHFTFDLVPDFSRSLEFFIFGTAERRRVRKTPVQAFGRAGENRALFGAGFIAHGNHKAVESASFEHVEHALRLVP